VINITEDKTIIEYTVRVRKPGKGTYDSIYVFGNSPEEFVQNLKDQLKERGYGELGKQSASRIKANLERQLQQFQNLDFANEGKNMKKSLNLTTLLKEDQPVKKTYEQLILDDMTGGCERIIDNINIKIDSISKRSDKDQAETSEKFWRNIRQTVKNINGIIRKAHTDITKYERDRIFKIKKAK